MTAKVGAGRRQGHLAREQMPIITIMVMVIVIVHHEANADTTLCPAPSISVNLTTQVPLWFLTSLVETQGSRGAVAWHNSHSLVSGRSCV